MQPSIPPAQRPRWQFVVPPQDELKPVLTFFALQADPDHGWISHSPSTVLVGADGKIINWYEGNQWTPDDVLKDLPTMQPRSDDGVDKAGGCELLSPRNCDHHN